MERNKLYFIDSIDNYGITEGADHVIHILCTAGCMSFSFQETHYNIAVGDYVILTDLSLASDFSRSEDFTGIVLCLSESFVSSMALRSNYGIIGHMSLLQNPVMKLSEQDFQKCRTDMLRLRERMEDSGHLFREEMIGHLLMAHILDLYDIHARQNIFRQVPERISFLLRRFIDLLYQGEYIRNRDLSYYASRLCITPHYLSEICKKASGKPATYWITRFTQQEIGRLLCRKELPLAEIASRMNFSSVSYLSRYVRKWAGVYPTEYRNNVQRK